METKDIIKYLKKIRNKLKGYQKNYREAKKHTSHENVLQIYIFFVFYRFI